MKYVYFVNFYSRHPGACINNTDFLALRIQDVGAVRVKVVALPDPAGHMSEFLCIGFNRAPNSGMQLIIRIKAHNGVRPVRVTEKEILEEWDAIESENVEENKLD